MEDKLEQENKDKACQDADDPCQMFDVIERAYEILGRIIKLMEETEDELDELSGLIKGFIKYCHQKDLFSDKKTRKYLYDGSEPE